MSETLLARFGAYSLHGPTKPIDKMTEDDVMEHVWAEHLSEAGFRLFVAGGISLG
jgi:hypothetical protein